MLLYKKKMQVQSLVSNNKDVIPISYLNKQVRHSKFSLFADLQMIRCQESKSSKSMFKRTELCYHHQYLLSTLNEQSTIV